MMETMDVDLKMRYNIYIYMYTCYIQYTVLYTHIIAIYSHVGYDIMIHMYGYVPQIAIVVW